MSRICPNHNQEFTLVCLKGKCNYNLLCWKCVQDHPRKHNEFIKEINTLAHWIVTYEDQRNSLISQKINIDLIKTQLQRECQNGFQEIKAKVERILANFEEKLLDDISKSIDCIDNQNMKIFTDLEVQIQNLERLNFKVGDGLNIIGNVIYFERDLKPSLNYSIESRNQIIANWRSPSQNILDGLDFLMESIFSKIGSEKTIESSISELQKLKRALNGDLEKNFNELRCRNEKFQKLIQDLKNKLEEESELGEKLERENESFVRQIEDLKNELEDESKLKEELERKNWNLERRIDDLENRLNEESELEEKLIERERRIDSLEYGLEKEKNLRKELMKDNESLAWQIEDLKNECERIRDLRLDCSRMKYKQQFGVR